MNGETADISASSMFLMTMMPPSSLLASSSFMLLSLTALTSNLGKLRLLLLEPLEGEAAGEFISFAVLSIKILVDCRSDESELALDGQCPVDQFELLPRELA